MKITRQKHAKKHLGFFRNNFGVREPYQILLDGTFCQAALRGRIQLREQLPRYLTGETQLCTTSGRKEVLEELIKILIYDSSTRDTDLGMREEPEINTV